MPEKKPKKAATWEAKTIGVEVLGPLRQRLSAYLGAHDGLKIKAVFNDAIDEYLKKRGA